MRLGECSAAQPRRSSRLIAESEYQLSHGDLVGGPGIVRIVDLEHQVPCGRRTPLRSLAAIAGAEADLGSDTDPCRIEEL